jgi:hypothetical protein
MRSYSASPPTTRTFRPEVTQYRAFVGDVVDVKRDLVSEMLQGCRQIAERVAPNGVPVLPAAGTLQKNSPNSGHTGKLLASHDFGQGFYTICSAADNRVDERVAKQLSCAERRTRSLGHQGAIGLSDSLL